MRKPRRARGGWAVNTQRSCYTGIREGFLEEASGELRQPSCSSEAGLRGGGSSRQEGTGVRGVGAQQRFGVHSVCGVESQEAPPACRSGLWVRSLASLGQDVCAATPGGGAGDCGRPRRRRPRTARADLRGQAWAEGPEGPWSRNQGHLRIQTCKDGMLCLSLSSTGNGAFAFGRRAARKPQ